jgi:beta-N-acetylhexosaminidase
MNLYRPIIIGIAGSVLTESEQSWLTELRPYGVILFSRNIDNPSQLKALCTSLRQILGDDVVIVIDQEGGRVQRLKQPDWPQLPAALDIGKALA